MGEPVSQLREEALQTVALIDSQTFPIFPNLSQSFPKIRLITFAIW
jgi:hypothetical protein